MPDRIMVVDDEPDLEHLVRQKFRREIREKDFEFVFAQNGVEALEKLANSGDVDLILTDINMPEMDGLTLLTKLAELDGLRKTIIVSAYGDMENIRIAMNRGAFDFVTKPIDLQDLETTINKSLGEIQVLREALKSRDQLVAIQRELNIANEIQTSILPQTFPPFPERKDFEIYAKMITAREVGGDFYDFFLIDDDRVGFAIGDVSGKGVPAAMLMAVCRTLLKATALKGVAPDTCLSQVNNILVDESLPHMFVTVFYGMLDTTNGELQYCNGGHNLPFLLSNARSVEELPNCGGVFLGGVKDVTYESNQVMLHEGDLLFLYTDGVTEAEDVDGEQFETTRLQDCLQELHKLRLTTAVERIVEEVGSFSEGVAQGDDITCLVVRYLGR